MIICSEASRPRPVSEDVMHTELEKGGCEPGVWVRGSSSGILRKTVFLPMSTVFFRRQHVGPERVGVHGQ